MCEKITGNPAQQLFPKPRMTKGARHNQIGAHLVRFGLHCVGNDRWK
jgi:hypothetical protein